MAGKQDVKEKLEKNEPVLASDRGRGPEEDDGVGGSKTQFVVYRLREGGTEYVALGPVDRKVAQDEAETNGGYIVEVKFYPAPTRRTDEEVVGMADEAQLKAQVKEQQERDSRRRPSA